MVLNVSGPGLHWPHLEPLPSPLSQSPVGGRKSTCKHTLKARLLGVGAGSHYFDHILSLAEKTNKR